MKQKDIALIVVIVFIAGLISYFVSGLIVDKIGGKNQIVEEVGSISSDFNPPDPDYFNGDSINPTQIIQIGDGNNPDPIQ
jgi:hypothetical protein